MSVFDLLYVLDKRPRHLPLLDTYRTSTATLYIVTSIANQCLILTL